ncbi:MAG TPA: hypothetical protein ENK31_00590 [Nannocystis exedens]|nr:hypothetical protein [Nannocystis exedens]
MNEPNPGQLRHQVVDPDDVGARADVVLGRRLPGLSRRIARRMALAGKLEIDGRRCPPSERVELGQDLVLQATPPDTTPPPLTILSSTDAIVYVAKPPGIAVHRLRPDEAPALADAVAMQFPECRDVADDPRELGALHRLDRPTSGVVAFARTAAAWRAGRQGLSQGQVDKRYAAMSRAAPPMGAESWLALPRDIGNAELPGALDDELAGVGVQAEQVPLLRISAALGHGDQRSKVAVRGDGSPAITLLQILAEVGELRLSLLRLESGHRHQARVHLAAIGWPLVGDQLYGGAAHHRLLLHAWSLDFSTVITGEEPVVAPLPEDFRCL